MDLLGSILDSMEKPPQLKQDVMRKSKSTFAISKAIKTDSD